MLPLVVVLDAPGLEIVIVEADEIDWEEKIDEVDKMEEGVELKVDETGGVGRVGGARGTDSK